MSGRNGLHTSTSVKSETGCKMAIQWDKSLYTKINAETRAELDRVNRQAFSSLPTDLYSREWGMQTTLRRKAEFLSRYQAEEAKNPA